MSSIIKKLLGSGNYITVNKIVIKKLGLLEAVLLGNFIDKYVYFEERKMLTDKDEFFNTAENIKKDTGITEHQQRQTIQTLCDYNLLNVNKKGLPAKNYYKLNFDKIEVLFEDSTSDLKNESLDKSNFSINNNTKLNNTKKELSKDNKEDKSSLIDLDSDFSPIKDEIIKYFDLYKKIHPMAKENKYFIKKKINKINTLCKYILNGFPKDNYNLIRTFIKDKNIPYNLDIGFNGDLNKFKELLNVALLSLDTNYNPSNKANITSNFSEFLINDFTEFSYFFEYAFNPPTILKTQLKVKEKYPYIVDWYCRDIGVNKSDDLIKFVNAIVKEHGNIINYTYKGYKRIDIDNNKDFINNCVNLDFFIQEHLYWLEEQMDSETFKLNWIWLMPKNTKAWSNFTQWFYLKFEKTPLYPLDETMQWKLNEYLERNT